jgi:hypothetical protein
MDSNKKKTTLILLAILTMFTALVGLNSCGSTITMTSTTSSVVKAIDSKILQPQGNTPWELSLYSIKWNGTSVRVNIGVTNKFNRVNSFDYVFLVADSYGGSFQPTEGPRPAFCHGSIYPDETKTGSLNFTVNPRSGNITLQVFNDYVKYIDLFALGSPN